MMETIQFTLNGKPERLRTEPTAMLMWALRNDLGLTGTKFSCGIGVCGACTVLLDDVPIRSCITPVSQAAGKRVMTIEGLAQDGSLHPLQHAFVEKDALQCGYCTPGMIMSAYGLLLRNPEPTRQEVITAMENNLCRCSAYNRIIEAIQMAGHVMKKEVSS